MSNRKSSYKFVFLAIALFVISIAASSASAQLSGPKSIPGDYATLALAVTDLNAQGVGAGGVTFNLAAGNPQTAPAGGYVIGGTGSAVLATASAANPVVFNGGGNTITAPAPQTVGNLNDGIFKIIGADWTTISGFVMVENPANVVTAAATNDMTEWGVALLYESATNGCQNITITGNTIDLNRTYQNTFGIYSNSTHTATAVTTSATATGATGGNHALVITANNITDVNNGIIVIGPTGAADNNDGLTIGGTAPNANTLTNFGTTGTFSGYANVSGTVNGILVRNIKNFSVSFNSLTSSAGGVTVGTLNGIQQPAASVAQTGTFTNNINNNTISLQSGLATGAINGINVPSGSSTVTSTLNINNNNFTNLNHSVAASGTIQAIVNVGTSSAGPLNHSISGNTFTNLTTNTTGSFTFISNSWARPTNGVGNINNNSIVTAFNKTGAGGTVTLYTSNSTSGPTVNEINTGNNFSNITVTGATTLQGWRSTDGGTPIKTVSNNIFNNWTGGTSQLTGLAVSFSGSATVSGNTVSNFNCACTIVGMESSSGIQTWSQNTINSLSSSGALVVTGLLNSGGTTQIFSRTKIYGLSNSNASGSVSGITVSSGTTINLQNNIIGDLTAPNANAAVPITGINVTGATTVNVDFNTVYVNATSAGALFGSAAINASTTPALTMRSNIFVNLSTPTGAGETVAYRRTSTTLTTYGAASNGNLFYAGTPSATNLIFTDLTVDHSTLAGYKALVASRDSTSVSENPTFVSTTGSSAQFLHINTVTPTQIESGGVVVAGIANDFDGDTRNVSTPDIGADEFAGTLLDLVGPTIAYTPLLNTSSTGDRILTATITDASGVPTAGVGLPVIYYRKNAGGWASTQCSFVAGNNYDCTIVAVAIGGVTTADVIQYYVAAQDTANNVSVSPSAGASGYTPNPPAAGTPPTTPSQYTIVAAISGTLTVDGVGGGAPNFASLTNAGGVFEYINNNDVAGNITINITADLTGENGGVVLNEFTSPFTILIKPSGGPHTITGLSATAIFKLNGADRVRFDGSTAATLFDNVVGGNPATRQLTVTNTGAGAIFWVATNASSGANNNTIQNLNMVGPGAFTGQGVIAGSGTTFGSAAENGRPNSNNTVFNCTAKSVQNAVFASGDPVTRDNGWFISQNDFGSAVVAEKLSFRGIIVQGSQNFQITQNRISGINSNTTTSSTMSGIQVAGVVNGGIVARNEIKDIRQTNTTGWGSNGIYLNASSAQSNIVVAANMISNIASQGFNGNEPTDNGYGIAVEGTGTGYTIVFNTIVMNAEQVAAGGNTAALLIDDSVTGVGAVSLRNNIFATTQTIGTQYNVLVDPVIPATVFSAIDYNDYFTNEFVGQTLGTNRTALIDWQGATGSDGNSVSADPVFASPTDFHLTAGSTSVIDKGLAGTGVDYDFDGQVRSIVGLVGGIPDIGADEGLIPTAAEVSVSGRVTTADGQGIKNAVISVQGGNLATPIFVRTASLGYYTIPQLQAGETYIITINSKRFIFSSPSRVVTVSDTMDGVDFVADPQ